MTNFTPGQADRMAAQLRTYRGVSMKRIEENTRMYRGGRKGRDEPVAVLCHGRETRIFAVLDYG